MAQIIPVLQAVGTVVSVISALSQGSAAKQAADYNARVNLQNAEIARADAAAQAVQADREMRLRLGTIRANQGASGGTADSGSALEVLGDVAAQSELEKQNILYRGELAARGYTNTASLDTYSGSVAQRAGYLRAGTELLAGGVRTLDAYGRLKRGG